MLSAFEISIPAVHGAEATDIKWGGLLSGPPSGVSLTADGTLLLEVSSSASRAHPREDRRILAVRDEGTNGRIVGESYLYGDMGLRALAIGPDGMAYGGTVANNSPFLGLSAVRYRPAQDLEEMWQFNNQGYGNLPTTPALGSEGELYVVTGQRLMRLDAVSGALVAQRSISKDNPECSPVVSRDGILFYSDGLHYFSAARLPGERLWSRYVDHEIHASPAIGADGRVYLCSRRQVLTFDPHSGEQHLLFDPPEFKSFEVVGSSPTIGPDNTLYVGSLDGYLYAIDALSGSFKARYDAGTKIQTAPAIAADGTVYFGTYGGYFHAVRLEGDHFADVAARSYLGNHVAGDPVIAPHGTVYTTTRKDDVKPGGLYALKGTGSGPARSAWPTYRQNAQRTGLQPTPPAIVEISAEPGLEIATGGAATLTAAVTGTPPLDFQWYHDEQPLPGATGLALSLESFSAAAVGAYRLSVINDAGEVSRAVELTLENLSVPPEIVSQPLSLSVSEGASAVLQVEVTGTTPISYQWIKDGFLIPGGIDSALSFETVSLADNGDYWVEVSNAVGSTMSDHARLEVQPAMLAPRITQHPTNQSVALGGQASFQVVADGAEPLAYQWFRNSLPIPGQNSANLLLSPVSHDDAGEYSVQVSNSAGTVRSAFAILTVWDDGNWGAVTFQNLDNAAGLRAPIFDADGVTRLSGESYMAELWAGRTVDTLAALASVPFYSEPLRAGYFPGRIVKIPGMTDGETAWVQVRAWDNADGRFLTYEDARAAGRNTGASTVFSVVVRAMPSLPAVLMGLESFSLKGPGSPPNDLVVSVSPSAVVQEGDAVVLCVEATGTAPLSYQWFRNGVPLSGATTACLEIAEALQADEGDYRVQSTNGAGSALSEPVTLTVWPAIRRFVLKNGRFRLEWFGNARLEWTDALPGGWRDMPGAESPFEVPPEHPARFFRLRGE